MTKVTIKDLARHLKVSTTTISNALNGKPGVGKKARKKILQMAKEMGYQPNYFAKGLVSKQSHAIGLTIANIADPFSAELARGVYEKANELGYTMMLFNTNYDIENEAKSIEILKSKGVDGIILTTVTQDDPNIDSLNEIQMPYVLVNRLILNPKKANRIDSVSVDDYGSFYKAAKHLCRLGHKNIAVIAGDMDVSTAIALTQGANDAFAEYGVTIPPDLFIECGFSREKAYQAAKAIFLKNKQPSAILIQGDNMAIGVREAAYEIGIKIPEDLSIVGLDDISISSLAGIELTTIAQNQYKMGATGVQLLIDKIKSEDSSGGSRKIVLESDLIIRKTCGYYLKGYVK
ncbi:MAG: LacI family DNA-binding transcriptional regulator [Desulfobacula sp.]|jgi:LacI family transcriptional regulator|uniref:LacI family DNA-binding transcriptional regulator n=1 Tax=Desulfobacula sp. TaxID=2593537 RepID=UPI001D30579D|nr:LacI family DNA-binding transcriptional regulator [Desulfobacula sp.]MBT3485646.1 LacI family DNA-binding transcriptional regulator [Desulfobacula sp.]MBT3805519.1 LacI family DNA-binding transcriptional regulator [Desulfobacula sp.]MBT4024818.1 LacI family DNA-binding transcriptional regulator [Desulfobacula sp.]MBT4200076.1 LacI family DNA-binding transcriptional regulator [Desulfobacula sp.]